MFLFIGQPYSNPDGSVYTYNPSMPLPNGQPPTSMYQSPEGWTASSVNIFFSGSFLMESQYLKGHCDIHLCGLFLVKLNKFAFPKLNVHFGCTCMYWHVLLVKRCPGSQRSLATNLVMLWGRERFGELTDFSGCRFQMVWAVRSCVSTCRPWTWVSSRRWTVWGNPPDRRPASSTWWEDRHISPPSISPSSPITWLR